MGLADQDLPLALDDPDLRARQVGFPTGARPSIDEGPGITRVVQDLQDARGVDLPPVHVALSDAAPDPARKHPSFPAEAPDDHGGGVCLSIGNVKYPPSRK